MRNVNKLNSAPPQGLLEENAEQLETVLSDFRVQGEITDIRHGPVVTRYDLEPAPGIKSQRVIALADDIARSMSALAVRVAVVPGQNVIGIELPNVDLTRDFSVADIKLLEQVSDAAGGILVFTNQKPSMTIHDHVRRWRTRASPCRCCRSSAVSLHSASGRIA